MPFIINTRNGYNIKYVTPTPTSPSNYIVLGGNGTTNNFATTYDGVNYTVSLFNSTNQAPSMMTGYNYVFCFYNGGQNTGPAISTSGSSTSSALTWSDTAGYGGQQVNAAAYFNGKFYAGGYNVGGINYSATPISGSWTTVAISGFVCSNLYSFTLNNTPYILAANLSQSVTNMIYYSTDGLTWTNSNANSYITYLGYNYNRLNNSFGSSGSMVIAIGANGANPTAIYSTNCSTWASCTFSVALSGNTNAVAYGNGKWFISTTTASTLWVSTNGTAFTSTITVPLTTINTISYVNGTWVIAGSGTTSNVYYSKDDGATWSAATVNIGVVSCSATAVK